jgi:hypothetical protein
MRHGDLARLKPAADHLTAYCLSMSLGGAIGGLLVNLVAPRVFTTFREFPLGMAAAAAAGGGGPAVRWSLPAGRAAGVILGLLAMAGVWHWRLADDTGDDATLRTVHRARSFYGTLIASSGRPGRTTPASSSPAGTSSTAVSSPARIGGTRR